MIRMHRKSADRRAAVLPRGAVSVGQAAAPAGDAPLAPAGAPTPVADFTRDQAVAAVALAIVLTWGDDSVELLRKAGMANGGQR